MLIEPPRVITDRIRELAACVAPASLPRFVPVQSRPDAMPNQSFSAVQWQVEEYGGSIAHGWTVWEWPGLMLQATFHAVWRRPGGRLLDVAHHEPGATRVLFLLDPVRRFGGWAVKPLRVPLTNDARIREYIAVLDKQYEITIGGERVVQCDEGRASPAEARELTRLRRREAELDAELSRLVCRNDAGRSLLEVNASR